MVREHEYSSTNDANGIARSGRGVSFRIAYLVIAFRRSGHGVLNQHMIIKGTTDVRVLLFCVISDSSSLQYVKYRKLKWHTCYCATVRMPPSRKYQFALCKQSRPQIPSVVHAKQLTSLAAF